MKNPRITLTAALVGLLAIPTVTMAGTTTSSTTHTTSSINSTTNNTTAIHSPYPGHIVEIGSTGIYVKEIQQKLNQLPKSNAGQADGIFGPKTLIAVELFQMSHGLAADGVVGPQTWNALFNNGSGTITPPPSTSHQYPGHPVRYGSKGTYVKEIQQKLNQLPKSNAGQADGIFGPKTLIAVELFQMSHGLTADGVVGPQTWNALFNG